MNTGKSKPTARTDVYDWIPNIGNIHPEAAKHDLHTWLRAEAPEDVTREFAAEVEKWNAMSLTMIPIDLAGFANGAYDGPLSETSIAWLREHVADSMHLFVWW